MSKQGSNSELFAHENDALTARPQLHVKCCNKFRYKLNFLFEFLVFQQQDIFKSLISIIYTNKSIDAFHRRLHYALCIRWPRKVSNEKLYQISKAEPWSSIITKRRFTFLGHILRLHHDTPAKEALKTTITQKALTSSNHLDFNNQKRP